MDDTNYIVTYQDIYKYNNYKILFSVLFIILFFIYLLVIFYKR